MKIYFGEQHQDVSEYADSFFSLGNRTFSACVEYGSGPGGFDDVTIFDPIGRSIPIYLQDIPDLIKALSDVLLLNDELETYAELVDEIAESNNINIIERD